MTWTARIPALEFFNFFFTFFLHQVLGIVLLHLLAFLPAPLHARPLASFPFAPLPPSPPAARNSNRRILLSFQNISYESKSAKRWGYAVWPVAARQSLERHPLIIAPAIEPATLAPTGARESRLHTGDNVSAEALPGSVADANPNSAKRAWGREPVSDAGPAKVQGGRDS